MTIICRKFRLSSHVQVNECHLRLAYQKSYHVARVTQHRHLVVKDIDEFL